MGSLYSVKPGILRKNATKDIQRELAEYGVNASKFDYIEVKSPGGSADTAYTNYFDGKNGVVICSENLKNRDGNPPGQKLWPSEILWQSWTMVAQAQGSRPSDLQVIVRYVVVNKSTNSTIWHAANLSTCTREGENYQEYTQQDQGYHAILGTVNGASTMRMLVDHKEEIGYRTVERVVVLGDTKLTLEGPRSRTFMILLSPCRIPPPAQPENPE